MTDMWCNSWGSSYFEYIFYQMVRLKPANLEKPISLIRLLRFDQYRYYLVGIFLITENSTFFRSANDIIKDCLLYEEVKGAAYNHGRITTSRARTT